jgi:hypothetical protein
MGLLQRLAELVGRRGSVQGPATPALEDPPVAPAARGNEPQRIVRQVLTEALATPGWRAQPGDSPRWRALKGEPAQLQMDVLFAALQRGGGWLGSGHSREDAVRKSMVSSLLRRNLPFSADDLTRLVGACLAQPYTFEDGPPSGATVLGAVERHAATAALTPKLQASLRKLQARAVAVPDRFHQGLAARIDRLLEPAEEAFTFPAGQFAKELQAWLAGQPEDERAAWRAVLRVAASGRDSAAPTGKWLVSAEAAMRGVEPARLTAQILSWLEGCTPDPKRPDISLDVLRGLIWMATRLDHAEVAGPVGRFAETCFRKVPGVGARSVKLGNAALWTLSEMAGEPRAAAELFRLRDKVRYPSAQRIIANRLAELAARGGQTLQELEDTGLPDFGLDADSRVEVRFGDARAELALFADRVDVRWFSSGGKPVKAAPAELRSGHAQALAEWRRRAKDVEEARARQATRLEQSWVSGRDWSLADWQANVLAHPVRRPLAEALIWRVGSTAVMSAGGAFSDVDGRARTVEGDARIRLWHPLDSDPEEVLAWRRHIVELGVTQPIKQAHREIYVLTDAERRTEIYSNRFAAHILRQHQFRALCQARGWTYDLLGGWDSWSVPTRALSGGFGVEYHVEAILDGEHSAAGVPLHLASDQVRFIGLQGRAVPLETVPPILFSEAMRDVDLFVAITSIANDPNWTDGGPDGRHDRYWREWAFGDLSQSAATRRDLIATIAPRLSIAEKLTVTDKYLVVRGGRHEYAIHFGSGNIQIRPDNRYLCIVPAREPVETASLKLPFAGDQVLSTILAKAFLLVDERRITDRTILSQL